MREKLCRKCGTEKLESEFNKDSSKKDGLQQYCRVCTKKLGRQYKERKALRLGRKMKPYEEKRFSNVTDDELLIYINKFFKENGRPPSTYDFEGNPDYPNAYTYYRHFKYKSNNKETKANSWNSILKLTGLKTVDYDLLWTAWEYLVELAVIKFEAKDDYIFQASNIIKGYRPDVIIPSKKLIIDAATSNYDSIHKVRQFNKAKSEGYKVEYWCLYKTTKNGINEPELTYVFADEIVYKLRNIGELELALDIENLLKKHDDYAELIIQHKKIYIRNKLVELAKILDRTPQTRDFTKRPNFPSAGTITKTFGTFNKALLYAGLEITREKIEIYNEQIAINDIVQLTKKLGRIPKVREIRPPKTTYTPKVYFKYFGGIYNCLKKLGLDVDKLLEEEKQSEIEERVNQVKQFKLLHDRYPKQNECGIKNNLPSYHWIYDHFGSMKNIIEYIEKKI